MKLFEDEMTEAHLARTEAEYRAVTRQEIREQARADEDCRRKAIEGEICARVFTFLRR